MKRAKEIVEINLDEDFDFFNEELIKFNKIKQNAKYYLDTPPPPDEDERKFFLEKKEKHKKELEENRKNIDLYRKQIGVVYKELIKNLKNNLEEHYISSLKSKQDREDIIANIEEYLENIKRFSLKIEEIKDDNLNNNPVSIDENEDSLFYYNDTNYKYRADTTRLKILIEKYDGNIIEFVSNNSTANIIEWIKHIGPENIIRYKQLFNRYFDLKENKVEGKCHYFEFNNKKYYLYLCPCGNQIRKSRLEDIMSIIYRDRDDSYTIILE